MHVVRDLICKQFLKLTINQIICQASFMKHLSLRHASRAVYFPNAPSRLQ